MSVGWLPYSRFLPMDFVPAPPPPPSIFYGATFVALDSHEIPKLTLAGSAAC